MSHENPGLYIVGTILLLFVGYALLTTGMDMGMVIVVICCMIAAGIGGFVVFKRYQSMGKEVFINSMISNMDPTLPAPFPEQADELTQAGMPFHMQQPFTAADEELFGGHIPTASAAPAYYRPSNTQFQQEQGKITSITEDAQQLEGTHVRGALMQGTSQTQESQYTLPASHDYELHLGDEAYVDVSQAYVNSLLLDPTGNIPRVMAEELASKGVPQLFIDITGDHRSLLSEFPFGYHLISSEAYQDSTSNTQTVALSQNQDSQAVDFGFTLMQYGWQALFDFSTYTSASEAMVVLWNVIDGMAGWERKQYRQSNRYLPAVITLTDAYRLCPDDDRHSLHKDNPPLAQAVRKSIIAHLEKQGNWGLYWYLVTRRVTGMDSEVLKHCRLWIVEHPNPAEVKTGWLSAYMGLSPQEIERVPQNHALILDRNIRVPQYIRFRHSHSERSRQTDALSSNTFTFPTVSREDGAAARPFQTR